MPSSRRAFATAAGKNYQLYTKDGVNCTSKTPGRSRDSRQHLYMRRTGFLRGDEDELRENPALQAAVDEHRSSGATKIRSHCQVVERVARFERFCIVYHPSHEYTKYLLKLVSLDDDAVVSDEKLAFMV